MKNSFKVVGVPAVALALVFSGYGRGQDSSSPSLFSRAFDEVPRTDPREMAMNGRKLVIGMIQANIDREGKMPSVWPRTWQEGHASDSSDVSARAYKSATDYFNALFDMEHYGTAEWDPCVDGELLSTLGKNAVVNGKINPAGLDWCIAANVEDDTQDFLPVLISANVNPALLCDSRFDGKDPRPLPIGPESGAPKSLFGDKAIVLVRKIGAAEHIKTEYARYNVFYNHQAFDNSYRKHPVVWLTPTGIAGAPYLPNPPPDTWESPRRRRRGRANDDDIVRGGADADMDGLPDAWEAKYGLNPRDPADAKQDPDGDTFTNLEEFEAKTDPKDPDSHPDFLDSLTIAGNLRVDMLPFAVKMATPTPRNYRFTFEVTARNQERKPVIGESLVRSSATAELGEEIGFESMKIKIVNGRMINSTVKTGWRVLKYNRREELATRKGTGQKVRMDASTVDLERISDKRVVALRVGDKKPVVVDEQIDLAWKRGEGKKFTVTAGGTFKLKNREYEVTKLVKDGRTCKVVVMDLKNMRERTIR